MGTSYVCRGNGLLARENMSWDRLSYAVGTNNACCWNALRRPMVWERINNLWERATKLWE